MNERQTITAAGLAAGVTGMYALGAAGQGSRQRMHDLGVVATIVGLGCLGVAWLGRCIERHHREVQSSIESVGNQIEERGDDVIREVNRAELLRRVGNEYQQ